jgi:hypothetical protein
MVAFPLIYQFTYFLYLIGSLPLSQCLPPAKTIFTIPGSFPASWFENLAVRPNGLILGTRGDSPEIWQIDPATGNGTVLLSVTGAFNLTGIAEILPATDAVTNGNRRETYIIGSVYSPAPLSFQPGSSKVWKLEFSNGTAPTVSLLTTLPDAGFINGIAAWGSDCVLLGDSSHGLVYLMNITTGSFTTAFTNMTGINGIKSMPGYFYWANTVNQTLNRIPVDRNATAVGAAEVLATEQPLDDFILAVDASGKGKAYVGALTSNAVIEVSLLSAPSSRRGEKRVLAEDLTGTGRGLCTVAVLGRTERDAQTVYAAVGMGGKANAAIVALSLGDTSKN